MTCAARGASPKVILIAAVASNGVIGAQGALPWRLPEDLRHFKSVTKGHGSPEDVLNLERELDRRNGSHLGIVLKVETQAAFEQLPNLLLTALRSPPVGVMVARGDLAVELGFERLAEVQEQILWLCEAAHVPVIWATQVLESLAKKGLPSRAEVTDAAMSGRAECVMLNKGPHVLNAVRFLDNVLTRMQTHQTKKRAMLRKLSVSDRIVDTHPLRPPVHTTGRNGA